MEYTAQRQSDKDFLLSMSLLNPWRPPFSGEMITGKNSRVSVILTAALRWHPLVQTLPEASGWDNFNYLQSSRASLS